MRILLKSSFMILSILHLCSALEAVTVSGRVLSEGSPVSGMVIGIEELNLIVESDTGGNFIFQDIEAGKYTLYFSHRDYGIEKIRIKAKRDFYLEKEIKKKVYDAGDKIIGYTGSADYRIKQSISREDIKKYPMRGAGDSLHLLHTLPGVGSGFSLATVPIIRGLNPLFNKYYIDDIPIDYPFHFFGGLVPLISSINEEAIDEVELIKGDAPVWTGDHLGNIISIRTRTVDEEGAHAKIILDPVLPLFPALSATLVPYSDLSILAGIRRSDFDWMIDTEKADLFFQDYYFKIAYQMLDSHRITLSGNGSRDELDYDDYETASGYNVTGLTWEYIINRRIYLKTILSRYSLEQYMHNTLTYTEGSGAYLRIYPEQDRLFQILSFSADWFFLKAGYEYIKLRNRYRANVSPDDIDGINFIDQTSLIPVISYSVEGESRSLFFSCGIKNETGWLNLGMKNEKYGITGKSENSYSGDSGINFIDIYSIYIKNSVNYAHPDACYYIGDYDNFKDAKAVNWGLGCSAKFSEKISVNAEFNYSKYDNLNPGIEYGFNDEFYKKIVQLYQFSDETDGKTYGGELYLNYSWNKISGSCSYSYCVSKRENNTGEEFYSDFDQTHIFRLLVSKKWKSWEMSVIWNQYSSLPYTPVTGSIRNEDDYSAVYGEKNSERFNMHSRADVKVSYVWGNGRFYTEFWNLFLDRNNAVFENFDSDDPYGSDNPENYNDLPVFFWVGVELWL